MKKVGEFDAGDAGNIEQGGNAMKEGEKRGGVGKLVEEEKVRWVLLKPGLVDGIVDREPGEWRMLKLCMLYVYVYMYMYVHT